MLLHYMDTGSIDVRGQSEVVLGENNHKSVEVAPERM